MYAPDWFNQVDTVGIFHPDSGAVGHKVIVCFETHAPALGWRAVGHAPQMPLFKLSFFGSLV
jgi:hypothetical protein